MFFKRFLLILMKYHIIGVFLSIVIIFFIIFIFLPISDLINGHPISFADYFQILLKKDGGILIFSLTSLGASTAAFFDSF